MASMDIAQEASNLAAEFKSLLPVMKNLQDRFLQWLAVVEDVKNSSSPCDSDSPSSPTFVGEPVADDMEPGVDQKQNEEEDSTSDSVTLVTASCVSEKADCIAASATLRANLTAQEVRFVRSPALFDLKENDLTRGRSRSPPKFLRKNAMVNFD